jgi:hypothetical protein
MFFCCYRAKRTMFLGPTLVPALDPTLVPVLDPSLVPAPSVAKNAKQVGGYGIGGHWRTNQAHGFCFSLPPLATKLKTT